MRKQGDNMVKTKANNEQKGRDFSKNVGSAKWVILLLIVLTSILMVFAVTEQITSFVGQDNPFNITFEGNENQTFYIDIPMYAYVENITITATGLESE